MDNQEYDEIFGVEDRWETGNVSEENETGFVCLQDGWDLVALDDEGLFLQCTGCGREYTTLEFDDPANIYGFQSVYF